MLLWVLLFLYSLFCYVMLLVTSLSGAKKIVAPPRLAKLSEWQLVDGRLECLYHGWQFEGKGKCVKISLLPAGAKTPKQVCVSTYEVRDCQGVLWVWMSQ